MTDCYGRLGRCGVLFKANPASMDLPQTLAGLPVASSIQPHAICFSLPHQIFLCSLTDILVCEAPRGQTSNITRLKRPIGPLLGRGFPSRSACLCVIGPAVGCWSANRLVPMATVYVLKEAPPYLTVGLLDLWDAISIDHWVDR